MSISDQGSPEFASIGFTPTGQQSAGAGHSTNGEGAADVSGGRALLSGQR